VSKEADRNREAGRIVAARRAGPITDPAILARIAALVAAAPPVSEAQRAKLAVLLRPTQKAAPPKRGDS